TADGDAVVPPLIRAVVAYRDTVVAATVDGVWQLDSSWRPLAPFGACALALARDAPALWLAGDHGLFSHDEGGLVNHAPTPLRAVADIGAHLLLADGHTIAAHARPPGPVAHRFPSINPHNTAPRWRSVTGSLGPMLAGPRVQPGYGQRRLRWLPQLSVVLLYRRSGEPTPAPPFAGRAAVELWLRLHWNFEDEIL
ncbi:MAG: hypothetical protein AAGC55_14995, partial [Myxococcota bacterium]